ncbi:type II secretion system F family protein [Kineosporia sp. A_224]|uniref:type II secretion system F family protein n=1 Tax=Kineosporia sp. A_224 TaxID=1962180 RepID=UPI000B4B89A0|nr:type II secretion system F family protein [Kineosporia sp. A_224]
MTAAEAGAALAAAAAVALLVRSPVERRLDAGRAGPTGPPDRGSPDPGSAHRPVHARVRRAVQSAVRRAAPRGPGRRRAWSAVDLEAVVALLDRVSALLRAGLGPRTVWSHLAAAPGPARPLCAFVAESLAAGGSGGTALRGAADLLARERSAASPPGPVPADVLRWLAVATAVSDRTGAPAADCVDRLSAAVRSELAAADERAAALAGPQATAQVLGWLPAAGLALGALVGADPVRVLLLTGPGRLCLAAGLLLWVTGRAWSGALVRRAAAAGR